MRRSLLAAGLGAVVTAGVIATAGAASAQADGTPVQFTVTGSGISITQPTALANLGSSAASDVPLPSTGVSLGKTTVSDQRAVKLGWTDSVAGPSAGFTDAAGDVIADSAVGVYLDPASIVSNAISSLTGGLVLPVSTAITPLTAVKLTSAPQTLVTMVNALGSSTSSFTPYANVTVPQTAQAGTYTGTITQTVS